MTHTISPTLIEIAPIKVTSIKIASINLDSIKIDPLNWMPERVDDADTDESATNVSIDGFLKTVERRALRMAELATSSRDDAMDLVQDAMFGFVRHYTDKPAADWAPLFYRVLDSRINDWHRRRTVRGRWLAAWTKLADDDEPDEIAQAPDEQDPGPLLRLAGSEASTALEAALKNLPTRQR